jgi:hypothetical protein
MKTITLAEAHQILTNSAAVVWGDYFLSYISMTDLTGEDDNEFAYLLSTTDDGEEYCEKFNEGANREVKVSDGSMFLINNDGEETQITVLVPDRLEKLSFSSI